MEETGSMNGSRYSYCFHAAHAECLRKNQCIEDKASVPVIDEGCNGCFCSRMHVWGDGRMYEKEMTIRRYM